MDNNHTTKKADALKFVHKGGHVECLKQILGKTFHCSWPSWEARDKDLWAFLELRQELRTNEKYKGVTLTDLASRLELTPEKELAMRIGPKGMVQFEKFCREVFPLYRKHKPSWKWEEKRMEQILRQGAFKDRDLHTIREGEIREWFNEYSHRPGVTSDNTRANMLKVLKAVFRLATELGYLLQNPAREIHLPPVPESRARSLSRLEAENLCRAADAILRPWIFLTLFTGLRPSEIRKLTTAQVDLAERRLTVVGSGTVKNRSREIYIHDALLPYLKELCASVPNMPLIRNEKGKPSKFPTRLFNRAREAAGLAKFTFYELRHTFCTRLMETGAAYETRAYVMGHRFRGMTARYTHPTFDMVRQAIELLPSVVVAPLPEKSLQDGLQGREGVDESA